MVAVLNGSMNIFELYSLHVIYTQKKHKKNKQKQNTVESSSAFSGKGWLSLVARKTDLRA